jgi:hypothetical protein
MSEIAEFTRHLGHYLPPPDVALVERAFAFSEHAHQGQFRKSGEPYITHPLAVASILSQWRIDAQGLAAALLHDVMEDTKVTKTEIESSFGKPVADMVDGVSKLDQIEFQSREDAQAENFRKMLLAMAQDVRVILIKLADRLHNMRTLEAMAPTHRKRIARETLDIYAPIANRLGLNELFHELQELAFSHTHPLRYKVLYKATRAARGNRLRIAVQRDQPARGAEALQDCAAVPAAAEGAVGVCAVAFDRQRGHGFFEQDRDMAAIRHLKGEAVELGRKTTRGEHDRLRGLLRPPGFVPEFELVALTYQNDMLVERGVLAQRRRHQNAPRAVEFDVIGVSYEQTLQAANAPIETRQRHEARLDRFPLGDRIKQQAMARIGREHHTTVGFPGESDAMFRRDGQPPLVVQREMGDATKHRRSSLDLGNR